MAFGKMVADYINEQTGDDWKSDWEWYTYNGQMASKNLQGFDVGPTKESLGPLNSPTQLTFEQFKEAINTPFKEKRQLTRTDVLVMIQTGINTGVNVPNKSEYDCGKMAEKILNEWLKN